MPLHVLAHPLASHLMTELRDRETPPHLFRQFARQLTNLLVVEATLGVATEPSVIQTPIRETTGLRLRQGLAAVPVLRAGLGMLETVLDLFPDVAVGYVGLERNHETSVARSYYQKLPPDMPVRYTLCLDPMLATGGSACQAIELIKASGAQQITMVCIVAAPEGVAKLMGAHPDVKIVCAALDEGLNEKNYIVPGLGDFGDRLYGTG